MPRPDAPVELILDSTDVTELRALADGLRDSIAGPSSPEFFDQSWPMIDQLPRRLRLFLELFRRNEPAAACLIHGFPVDDDAVGPTPPTWESANHSKSCGDQEIFLAMCAMILGEPFAWETLQSGRLIQNILPIHGDERRQSGHGSQTLLEFHTEDGFHPRRCDYLLLLGVRNPDRVPTIVASVRNVDLPARVRDVLSQDRFCITPDDEHIRQIQAIDPDHPVLVDMYRMKNDPIPTAVLFGHRLNPYLRIDRPFMYCAGNDREAEAALDVLMDELHRVQEDVVVGPGTLLVVDNHLAVHGRRPFAARYDGTDRWLKKITVSRDLRRGLVDGGSATHRVFA
jgi:L-asparagine oxygenase